MERKQITEGVFLTKITDKRFKTNMIAPMFITEFGGISRADYAVAASVLTDRCAKYPTYSSLSKRLAELYDASFSSGVSIPQFDRRCSGFVSNILDNRYSLEGENLEEEMCGVIMDCVFDPLLENGVFDRQTTELMRSELIDSIDSIINNKAAYAAQNADKTAFIGEICATPARGTHEEAEKVTPQSAFGAYREMLETARVEIMCVGGSDFSAAENAFTNAFAKAFKNINRHDTAEIAVSRSLLKAQPAYISDTLEMQQAILRMYFKAPELADRYANALFMTILGGMTTSRFFSDIREKQSLCYYCAAGGSYYKGNLVAYAGVEPDNIEKTQAAILAEIKDIQENGVTGEELETALKEYHNNLISIYDSPTGIGGWYLDRLADDAMFSPEEYWEKLKTVTPERIQAAARLYKLDTVYTLSGGDKS